ncbi:MAG TPA: DUF3466 family protein [Aliidiomarina sp.]|nr:DUF3466 family protein [Aliidiomarina sp.]
MRLQKKYLTIAISALFVSSAMPGMSTAAYAKGYEVIDFGSLPFALSATANDMNEQGNFVGVGYNIVDLPIRTELLNPDDFESIDDLNNLNATEYLLVRNSLLARGGKLNQPEVQKITQYTGLWYNGVLTSINDSLDVIEPATGLLSRSNDAPLYGINNNNEVVGELRAPFVQVNGTDAEGAPTIYFVRDRFPQALWSNGVDHVELSGEDGLTYGGTSRAYAISDNNYVVGFASVEDTERVVSAYATCNDPESTSAHLPLDACMYRAWANSEYEGTQRRPLYNETAYLWELDATGTVVTQRSLGLAPTILDENEGKDEDKQIIGEERSEALDVNEQGVAVGFTQFTDGQYTQNHATIFIDGEANWLIPKGVQGFSQSKAAHINNNGYIAGYATRVDFQFGRERLFIGHTDGREVIFPSGFFSDSSWRPHGINNYNQVVGRAERDRTQVQSRRTVAFKYDIETDTVTDLNSLLACDAGYDLFDAVSINDNGDIIALANMKDKRVVDGREYDGLTVRPVLIRASDTVQACGDRSEKQERKGAAIGPIQLAITFIFGGVLYITRRRRKVQK